MSFSNQYFCKSLASFNNITFHFSSIFTFDSIVLIFLNQIYQFTICFNSKPSKSYILVYANLFLFHLFRKYFPFLKTVSTGNKNCKDLILFAPCVYGHNSFSFHPCRRVYLWKGTFLYQNTTLCYLE